MLNSNKRVSPKGQQALINTRESVIVIKPRTLPVVQGKTVHSTAGFKLCTQYKNHTVFHKVERIFRNLLAVAMGQKTRTASGIRALEGPVRHIRTAVVTKE